LTILAVVSGAAHSAQDVVVVWGLSAVAATFAIIEASSASIIIIAAKFISSAVSAVKIGLACTTGKTRTGLRGRVRVAVSLTVTIERNGQ
jgi:hypothetical protein